MNFMTMKIIHNKTLLEEQEIEGGKIKGSLCEEKIKFRLHCLQKKN